MQASVLPFKAKARSVPMAGRRPTGAFQLSAMAAALVTDAFPSELLILSLKEISWARGLRMPVTHRFQAFPCRMVASPRKLSAFVSKEQSFVLPYNRAATPKICPSHKLLALLVLQPILEEGWALKSPVCSPRLSSRAPPIS